MKSRYLFKKKEDFIYDDQIRTLLEINEKENRNLRNVHIVEAIIGIDEYDNFPDVIEKFNADREIILSKLTEKIYINEKYVEYIVSFDDELYKIYIIDNSDLVGLLPLFSKFEVHIDKDIVLGEDYKVENTTEWIIPDKDDFIEECIDFYIELFESALNYEEGNVIKANLLRNNIVDRLIYIINTFISLKYNNKIKTDQFALNYSMYLDNDIYESFRYINLSNGDEDFWTSIFKSAQVFRSIALEIAVILEYTYPKKEDVEIMQVLRQLYNKERK